MSKLTDDQRFKIIGDLSSGITPQEIAETRDVAYATVLRIKRDFETAKNNNTLDQLVNMPEVLRSQLMETMKNNTPAELHGAVAGGMAEVAKQLDMATALQETLMATANKLSERIGILIMRVETPSELHVLADSLSILQNAFFNKALTQVNVQNNYGEGQANKYQEFLRD